MLDDHGTGREIFDESMPDVSLMVRENNVMLSFRALLFLVFTLCFTLRHHTKATLLRC